MIKKGGKKVALVFVVLFIFLTIFFVASAAFTSAVSHPKYQNIADKINVEGRARVIIVFEQEQADTPVNKHSIRIKSTHERSGLGVQGVETIDSDSIVSEVQGFEKRAKLNGMDAYVGELSSDGLEELKLKGQNSGLSVQVYEDKAYRLTDGLPNEESSEFGLMSTKYSLSQPGNLAELETCIDTVSANYSWDTLNITGNNITVAILDTGINWTNAALGGCYGNGTNDSCKVFDGIDYYNRDGSPPWDRNTHGTGIAGILSGNGSSVPGGSPKGVAPASRLLAVKVCNDDAGNGVVCYTSDIMDGITWAVDHNASIISLSIGSGDEDVGNTGRDLLSEKINWAVDNNVVVAISAGNKGPGSSTISTPGVAEKAITVGAIYTSLTPQTSDDLLWYESGSGPSSFGRLDPEIVAPGADYIYSTAQSGMAFMAPGTSFSTPFVSGAAALLLEQAKNRGISLTPLQVRAILMQSAGYIYGTVFDRGAGELNIQKALTLNAYALVRHVNTYGNEVDNDRWEFIITPYSTNYANLTIFNNNDYNITLNSTIESFYNMENDNSLSGSQLKINSSINISNNTNITIQINFTLDNFASVYAATYGGLIILNGSGDNGTANVSKIIKIPVIITVPIYNQAYLQRNITERPSVYSYCYYSVPSRGIGATINWSDSDNWLKLELYNSSGSFITSSNSSDVNTQFASNGSNNTISWLRIYGHIDYDYYYYNAPVPFTMNVTTFSNAAPTITNISPITGYLNGTDTFLFYRPNNLTLNITYNDTDGDIVNVTINDTGYVLIDNSSGSDPYVTFRKLYNVNLPRTSSITITLTDTYNATYTKNITILLYTQNISINSYTPTNSTMYVRRNDSINFTINITESSNQTLYYYWWINNTLNSTASSINQNQSFIFNTTGYSGTWYNIRAFISNSNTVNTTNETVLPWTVYLDSLPPTITIQSPPSYLNQSKVDINFTLNDPSPSVGINNCWYTLNGSYNDADYNYASGSIACNNTPIYLGNGPYTIYLYANDSLGNSNFTSTGFYVNDTSMPVITVSPSSPSGTLSSSTTLVTLAVYTDESATCKYSPYTDIDYSSMGYAFSDSVTNHTTPFAVTAGNTYNISVRCIDIANNAKLKTWIKDDIDDEIGLLINNDQDQYIFTKETYENIDLMM